ncbi:hypothetical protein PV797_09470 [Clostridiaceae bacterium M8S5]|nr:hypothetical protein PV797_09470 [Clostridiaceae bacterium M8S5]
MKTKLKVFVLLLVLIMTTSICFADMISCMEREDNDTISKAEQNKNNVKFYSDIDGMNMYGYINNIDTVDYWKLEPLKTGVASLYMQYSRTVSAKLSLYNSDGILITSKSGDNTGALINDIVLRKGRVYYLKAEYTSGGMWKAPYSIKWRMDKL